MSEIRVTAAQGGRRLTLDPIVEHDVIMHARQVESSIEAGFRVGWLSGAEDGVEVSLSAGAGFGSPYLTLTVEVDGETIEEVVDMRDVTARWVEAVLTRSREGRQT